MTVRLPFCYGFGPEAAKLTDILEAATPARFCLVPAVQGSGSGLFDYPQPHNDDLNQAMQPL